MQEVVDDDDDKPLLYKNWPLPTDFDLRGTM